MASRSIFKDVDGIGAICSGLCSAHCAFMGLLPAVLAGLGLGAVLGETSEWLLSGVALLLAGISLVAIWRRSGPAWLRRLFAVGMLGLVASTAMEALDLHGFGTFVGISSGLVLVTAHILSRRHQASCAPAACASES